MKSVLLVALGGALGALARYAVAVTFFRRFGHSFPWGTLAINLSGCFVIAVFLGWHRLPEGVRLFVPVGFVGAYTTFSSYEWELMRLAEMGRPALAFAYLAASNVFGFAAVLAGAAVGRRL